jgi:phasin family protein
MAKTETNGMTGFFDATKVFGEFGLSAVNLEAIIASQRKQLEAWARANQLAIESARAVTQHQTGIMQQIFVEAPALFQQWTQPSAPQDRLDKNFEVAQRTFEKGVANTRAFTEWVIKANADAFGVIAKSLADSLEELRNYARKRVS